MKEIILLCLAVYGLHSFAQSTERSNVKTVPNRTAPNSMAPSNAQPPVPSTNMDPQRARGTTDGSMNSDVPPINQPDRGNVNTINDYPNTRARDAALQGTPSRLNSSDSTQRRTN